MNIPPPGDHKAKPNGPFSIGLASTGALCITLPCVLTEGEHAGFTCEWLGVLFNKEGVAQQNTIDNLKEVFGWDGQDPYWLVYVRPEATDMETKTFSNEFILAQCKHEEYEGKTRFKPGFLNAPARRISLKPVSRQEVLAKYGPRFRAMAGGAPARPAAASSAPKAPTAPSAPAPTAPGCTKDEVWQAFVNDRPGAKHEEIWFAAMREINKSESEYTPQDWAALKAKLLSDNQLPG